MRDGKNQQMPLGDMRIKIAATLFILLLLILSIQPEARAQTWIEYLSFGGVAAPGGELTLSKGSSGTTLALSNTELGQWIEVAPNGFQEPSPQSNLSTLVSEWPAIYGDGTANALLTVNTGLRTINLSLNLGAPELNGNELVFNDVTSGPLSSDLKKLFPGATNSLQSSLQYGSFNSFRLAIDNHTGIPHDILSASIKYTPPAQANSEDPLAGSVPCSQLIGDPSKSQVPGPGNNWAASQEISWIVNYTKSRTDLNSLVAPWGGPVPLSPDNFVAIARASVLPCDPQVDASKPATFPANVRLVDQVLGQSKWNDLTTFLGKDETGPFVASTFSYQNFLNLIARNPFFCGEPGSFSSVEEACKRELALVFAHAAQETGAHEASSSTPQWQQAFAYLREATCWGNGTSGACSQYNPTSAECPAVKESSNPFVCPVNGSPSDMMNPTLQFYGRGIKQLSYFYNSAGFGGQYLGDFNQLLGHPDLVASDGYLAISSGVWFEMSPQPPKPSMHDVIVGTGAYQPKSSAAGIILEPTELRKYDIASNRFLATTVNEPSNPFMVTISVINGGVECNSSAPVPQAVNRINYYYNLLQFFGASLTPLEMGYATSAAKGCTIANGNPFIDAALIYNPIWWIKLKDSREACGAVSYQATPPLSLVPDQNWTCLCPQPGQNGECPAADNP
jgi:hypothetical protein